jgi:DNA polymerase III epsilon subunit-like protein
MNGCPGLIHLNGNMLASVDVETTGTVPGYHEIVQIALAPLNSDLQPLAGVTPFYTNLRPEHPKRVDLRSWQIHGLRLDDLIENAPSQEKAADLLLEWFESLHLPVSKRLVPLAHNWPFECGFLKAWLGPQGMDHVFHYHPRDAMGFAVTLNDKAVLAGRQPPFDRVSLSHLCQFFNVANPKPHDALSDALAEAEVYRAMLTADL